MSTIDISAHLARPLRSRVHHLGVELEGGWNALPDGTVPIRDGSIHFTCPPIPADKQGIFAASPTKYRAWMATVYPKIVGELPSPPMEQANIETWLRKFYPPFHNATCGMHVHMSFKHALTYQRLMVPEFQDTVVEYFKRWALAQGLPADHPIWPRLHGESKYCQLKFFADQQAAHERKDFDHHREGCRYTAIHYAYKRIGTVECRLLPMLPNVDVAISAVRELVKITTAFLVATARREAPIDTVWVTSSEPTYREEFIECV